MPSGNPFTPEEDALLIAMAARPRREVSAALGRSLGAVTRRRWLAQATRKGKGKTGFLSEGHFGAFKALLG